MFSPICCSIGFHVSKLLPKSLFEDLDVKNKASFIDIIGPLITIVFMLAICLIGWWLMRIFEDDILVKILVFIITSLWFVVVGIYVVNKINNLIDKEQ